CVARLRVAGLAGAVVAVRAGAPAGDRIAAAGYAPELTARRLALPVRVAAAVRARVRRARAAAVHGRAGRLRLRDAVLIPRDIAAVVVAAADLGHAGIAAAR